MAKRAAEDDYLKVLKWARAEGYLRNTSITSEAAASVHGMQRPAREQHQVDMWKSFNGLEQMDAHGSLMDTFSGRRNPDASVRKTPRVIILLQVGTYQRLNGLRRRDAAGPLKRVSMLHNMETWNAELGTDSEMYLGCDYVRCSCKRGHFEVLLWDRAHGCPWRFDSEQSNHATDIGHLQMLQWLHPRALQQSEGLRPIPVRAFWVCFSEYSNCLERIRRIMTSLLS